jgi:hypothetical protein
MKQLWFPSPLAVHTLRVSPIDTTQQGIIAEQEFTRLLILESARKLEVSRPMADDERHDFETHIYGQFPPRVIFQVR